MEDQKLFSKECLGKVKVLPYNFTFREVITEAWQKIKGFKKSFWGAIGLFALAILLGDLTVEVLALATPPKLVINILLYIFQLLISPLVAGLAMLGVRRGVDLPIRASMVCDYYKRFWPIVFTMLLAGIVTALPISLGGILAGFVAESQLSHVLQILITLPAVALFLISIYFMYAYSFAMLLVAEKKLTPWCALQTSRRAVNQHWFKIFFISIVLIVIFLLSAIPLGIGLIWTMPLGYCVYGVLYRIMFGVDKENLA